MRPKTEFLLTGDVICDLITPLENTSMQYIPYGGGAIANMARHLGMRDREVCFLTVFSPDPFGTMLRRELKEHKIDLSLAQTIAQTETPLCFISNDETGERYFLHRGGDPYRQYLLPQEPLFTPTYDFFVWGISSLRTPDLRRLVDSTIQNGDGLTVCDPGSCPEWWGEPNALKVHLLERLSHIDIFKCSMPEAIWLTGQKNAEQALEFLHQRGVGVGIITDGANGLYVRISNETEHLSVAPCNAVDTTGAGDATLAGFLNALDPKVRTASPQEIKIALKQGIELARVTVQHQGAGPWQLR